MILSINSMLSTFVCTRDTRKQWARQTQLLQPLAKMECFLSYRKSIYYRFILCVEMFFLYAYLCTTCEPAAFRGERVYVCVRAHVCTRYVT